MKEWMQFKFDDNISYFIITLVYFYYYYFTLVLFKEVFTKFNLNIPQSPQSSPSSATI